MMNDFTIAEYSKNFCGQYMRFSQLAAVFPIAPCNIHYLVASSRDSFCGHLHRLAFVIAISQTR